MPLPANAPESHPLFCPIEPAIHPQVDLVEQRAVDWLSRQELGRRPATRDRLIGTNSAEFYARITPDAPAERLQLAVQWCYWGFAFDDNADGGPGTRAGLLMDRAARLLRVVESPQPSLCIDDPYLAALSDIAVAFRCIASDSQMRRWGQAHRGWMIGMAWEASNIEARVIPTLADYLSMRLGSCGGEPTTAMIDMATGAEVPAREMDAPLVIALTEVARMVAALDNDLVSHHRETRIGLSGQNLIHVIAHEDKCSPEQALDQAIAIRDRVMLLFLRLRDRLPLGASQELRGYVTSLGQTIRGNLDWSLRTPRYHSLTETRPRSSNSPRLIAQWSNDPSSTDPRPLPVPCFAWWWELL